jgi:hypothetical protein
LATRTLGLAASCGQTSAAEWERCADRGTLERCTTHDWSPAIGTALKAGYRSLDVYCGGCRQVKAVDLAAVDMHRQACLTSLILIDFRLTPTSGAKADAKKEKRSIDEHEAARWGGLAVGILNFVAPTVCHGRGCREQLNSRLRLCTAARF